MAGSLSNRLWLLAIATLLLSECLATQAPVVCELYAGLGMLSSALQAVGFTVAYLCEYQPQLKSLLAHKFPGANVQPNVDTEPWVQWAAAGGRALLIVAGIACQPFSKAGRMLGSRDRRAFQALKVLAAAIALHASYVLLENVPGLVDNDSAHGVFSIICYRYASAGYDICQVLRLNHSECAGGTIRDRIFILFTKSSAPRVVNFDVAPPACLAARLPKLQGDNDIDWRSRGTVEPHTSGPFSGSKLQPVCWLQLGTKSICQGCIIQIPGDETMWRVMRVDGQQLELMNADRLQSNPLKIAFHQSLKNVPCKLSRFPVYRHDAVLPTITASGEPPRSGGGGLILLEDGRIATPSTEDRFVRQDIDSTDLATLRSLGCTKKEADSAAGNCVPGRVSGTVASKLSPSVMCAGQHKACTVEQAQAVAADTPKVACGILQPVEAPSTQQLPAVDSHRQQDDNVLILFLPVLTKTRSVLLYKDHRMMGMWVPRHKATRGHLCSLIQPHWHREVYLGGPMDVTAFKSRVHVVTAAAEAPTNGLQACSLSSLPVGLVSRAASLALARVLSHGNRVSVKDILPLTGAFSTHSGAMPARPLQKTRSQPVRAWSRVEAQQACDTTNDAFVDQLLQLSEHTDSSPEESQYLQEWSQQVPPAVVSDIPDGLLENIPAFTDREFDSLPFAMINALPSTKALPPVPAQQTPSKLPDAYSDLLTTPKAKDKLCSAQDNDRAFLRMVQHGDYSPIVLKRARHESTVIAASQILGGGETIWDCRQDPPVPADFTADIDTHLNREAFAAFDRKLKLKDRQIAQFLQSGVRSQTDHLKRHHLCQPPLLSLADGFQSASAEIDRVSGQIMFKGHKIQYLQKHKRSPFIPSRGIPQGIRDKKGTAKKRKISNYTSPHHHMEDSDGEEVESFNHEAKYTAAGELKLPPEVKPGPKAVMNDTAVLRRIGDCIGFLLIYFTDDMADFFLQLKLHPSELWKVTFPWLDNDGELIHIAETVLGFGLSFASNVAQRFANVICQIFLDQFVEADAPYLAADVAKHPALDEWVGHRRALKGHDNSQAYLRQDRLISAGFYTDDLFGMVLGAERAARAIRVWFRVTGMLRVITAVPRKRIGGCMIPWTGMEYNSVLGAVIVPVEKEVSAQAKLLSAEHGALDVAEYRQMMGLLEFICYVLVLGRSVMYTMYEPLCAGGEIDHGTSTKVKAHPWRVKLFRLWRERLSCARFALCSHVLATKPLACLVARCFVWYADAALKGTVHPALCGYSHGMFYVFELQKRHVQSLGIAVLEVLAQIANFMVFGPLLEHLTAEHLPDFAILLQCDSLVGSFALTAESAKDPMLQFVHSALLSSPAFNQLKERAVLGHVYGEGNVASDHGSRGRIPDLLQTCADLGVKARQLTIPNEFSMLMERSVKYAQQLKVANRTQTTAQHKVGHAPQREVANGKYTATLDGVT